MASTPIGESTSSSWMDLSFSKISSQKILQLDANNRYKFNDKVKVILINCKNFVEVQNLLSGFRSENFPNVFVIFLKIEDRHQNDDVIRNLIDEKLPKSRHILLQINSKNFLRVIEKFKEINTNLNENEINENLNASKFSTKIFLSIQNKSKSQPTSLITTAQNFIRKSNLKSAQSSYLGAINNHDDFCVRLLNLFDFKLSDESKKQIFNSVIQSQNFETFLAFFDVFEVSKIKTEDIEKYSKLGDAFLQSVYCNNVKVFKFLLSKINLSFPLLKVVLKLSIEKDFFEIFNELKTLKVSESFAKEFNELKDKGEKDLKDIENFHQNIKKGNLEEVKKFSLNYPNYKLCYGLSKFCALELAIDHRQCKIYSYLRGNGFYTDKGSHLEEKIERLSESQKSEIRLENLKYVQEFPDAFIGILLSKCKFDACSPVSSSEVHEMLTDLSRVPELRPLLQIAAQADLKIIFDFATESVKSMDPTADEHVMGLAYFSRGELYVGRDQDKFSRYGVFIHELTHMVLQLIYENKCLPYCKGDVARETEWDRILENERKNFNRNGETVESIIQLVFLYKEGWEQLAELAVRPNHIRARYLDNPERVEELRIVHSDLFNNIQNYVLRDLQIPNVFRLINLNTNFEVIDKIETSKLQLEVNTIIEIINHTDDKIVISSNVPKLALSKLYNEIKVFSSNKLDVKIKNIFVDVDKLEQIYFKNEVKILLETSTIDRIIFDATDVKNVEKFLEYLTEFTCNAQIIVVCDQTLSDNLTNEENFTQVNVNFSFEQLTRISQIRLRTKELIYQGRNFKVLNFLSSFTPEILPLLCSNNKISINLNENLKSDKNFIQRILLKNESEFTLDQFHVSIQNEQFVVISDVAGSGKTTLLQRIGEVLLQEYPKYWISFVQLRDHMKQLSENSKENFEDSYVKILNLSSIEREIFFLKFSKGEVKILFDGFDEISPQCKTEALKLLKAFKRKENNQIIVTTRTHLEHDLEHELSVESFKIKNLTDDDQIKFLFNFWKNAHKNQELIKSCAQQLTIKINEMVKDHPNLIGVPIIIQSVAKLFINKINENFPNEIKNLKFCDVYRKILEECLNLLNKNHPTNVTKRLSPLQVFEYFAIVYFFSKNVAKDLGLVYDDVEWPVEEVSRYGLLSYDKDGKIHFNHQTYAEHLLSTFLTSIFKNLDQLLNIHIELLFRVLKDIKFKISQIFLDEMLENVQRSNLKIFRSESDLKLFHLVVIKRFSNLLRIFLNSNLKDFCVIEDITVTALLTVSDSKQDFTKFFEVVQAYFDEDLWKVLVYQNKAQETILHLTVRKFEIFKIILNAIKNNEAEKVLVSSKTIFDEEVQKEIIRIKDNKGQNILMISTFKNEKSFKILLKFIDDLMHGRDMENFLNELDEDGNNVLHLAALHLKSVKFFKILWKSICKNINNKAEFCTRRGKFGNSILQSASLNQNGSNILTFILNVMENFCKNHEIQTEPLRIEEKNLKEKLLSLFDDSPQDHNEVCEMRNLFLQKNSKNQNLLCTLAIFAIESNLKFLISKLYELFLKKDVKKLLKCTKDGIHERNLLSLSTQNPNLKSIKFMWKTFEENLNQDEVVELLSEKDKNWDNFLHLAVHFSKSKEIFEFNWSKICANIKDDESLKSYLTLKGYQGQNILLQSISHKNENSFYHIFENIFGNFLIFKDFIKECDSRGENFFHRLARFGSVSMIEFTLKELKEKLPNEELKIFIMTVSRDKNNVLHCAAESNQNSQSLKVLASTIRSILGRKDFQLMLIKDNSSGFYPLHQIIRYNSLDNFKYFKELHEQNLVKEDIKKILDEKDFEELATKNEKEGRMKENVVNYYESISE